MLLDTDRQKRRYKRYRCTCPVCGKDSALAHHGPSDGMHGRPQKHRVGGQICEGVYMRVQADDCVSNGDGTISRK